MELFRFPRTPHIAWLGTAEPRDDKVLSPGAAEEILAHEVVIEEKVDGANVGFSVDEQGALLAQNRGAFISQSHSHPQFKPLFRWLGPRRELLVEALYPDLVLFGEWCYALHSVPYTKLPDWFLAFDVYDRSSKIFWSTTRRSDFARDLGISVVPVVAMGRFDLDGMRGLLGRSQLSESPAEGLYIRWDEGDRLVARAKLVRPEFVQTIGQHWSRRVVSANLLAGHA